MRPIKISNQITTRESPSLDKYLQEIGKISLLSTDEEIQLTRKIKEGDKLALDKLTKANLRFVVSISKQYQNQGLTLGDLINEGNMGLIKSAERFDETRGFKFISFAVWWIRQSILQALADQSRIVRLPLNRVGSLNKLNKTMLDLEQKYEREPSTEELAEELDMTISEIDDTLRISKKHISMDLPIGPDDENSLLDIMENENVISPDSVLVNDSLKTEISRVLHTLTERESDVITLYYGLNNKPAMSLDDIGIELGITRERVRQIREKTIEKLQDSTRNKFLKSYLG